MTRISTMARVGSLVALLAAGVARAAAARDSVVVVHLENHARVPEREWLTAEDEVEAVMRPAGVTVVWAAPLLRPVTAAPRDGRVHLALSLLPAAPSGATHQEGDVLGRAAPACGRAWVFTSRVADLSARWPVDPARVLGRVIAHELGHLLLPGEPHTSEGIMRPHVALGHTVRAGFSAAQSRRIRATLAARLVER